MRRNSFNRFFFHFFPIPNFFAAPSFGLDISDESIKYVELIETRRGLGLGRYGEKDIPAGIIESGKIKDPKRMQEIMTALRKEAGMKSVRVSLPEEQVYLFNHNLEKSGIEDIRESIELVLEEHIPINAEDAIFDYEIIKDNPQSLEIEVATIPKNVIEEYLSIFESSNIRVQSFELEAQAISRSIIKDGDEETYMIVDFGKNRTGIFIVSRGIVMFTSTLDIGGSTLTNMIAKNFNISIEEAEKLKQTSGLMRNTENKEIFPVLLNSVSVLRDEIVKHLLYWQTHKNEKGENNPPIKKIILCGRASNLPGICDYFSISTKHKVEMANVWTNVLDTNQSTPAVNFGESLGLSTAIGLALGDFENN